MFNRPLIRAMNPMYEKVLARANTLGYTVPSARVRSLDSGLMSRLLRAGAFFTHDIIQIWATDGDRDFAKINWRDPSTFAATEVGTPDFHVGEGFSANTTANYVRLNFVASTQGVMFTRLSHSIYVYVFSTGDGYVMGAYRTAVPAGGFFLNLRTSPSFHGYGSFTGELAWPAAYADSAGGYQIVRDSDTSIDLRKDGTTVGTNAATTTRDVDITTFATIYNREGTPTTPNNNAPVSCVMLGSEDVPANVHNHFKYRIDRL